jgi:hypothetical protein
LTTSQTWSPAGSGLGNWKAYSTISTVVDGIGVAVGVGAATPTVGVGVGGGGGSAVGAGRVAATDAAGDAEIIETTRTSTGRPPAPDTTTYLGAARGGNSLRSTT